MCRTVIWYYEFWYDNILTLTGAMTAHYVLYCQARRWGEEWSLVHAAPTFKLIAAVKNCPVSHRQGRGQPGMGGQVRNKTPLSDDQQLTVAVLGLGITVGYSYSDDAESREGCTTAPGTTEQVSLLIGLSPVSMLTRVKSPKSDFHVGKSCSSLSKLKLKVCYELIMTFGIQISTGRAGAGEASPAI